ncbi:cysteine hydrolase family protein [Streptomyces phaeochromogenes]|uniref:cysteine hydrolase family protein n=1 Tax=Streptomyces phaeochromogenes TaxID=1923 RepID=UPI0036B31DBC
MTELDPSRTAVINVHWQRDIVKADGAFGPFFAEPVERRGVIAGADRLNRAARDAGATIVYTRVAFRPGYPDLFANCPLLALVAEHQALEDGTEGAAIVKELTPEAGDLVITHPRITGFHGTELDVLLRGKGIDTVLFTGVATNVSVEGTAREAVNHGYRTVLVSDACSAASDEAHQATLDSFALLGEVSTTDALVAALKARTP